MSKILLYFKKNYLDIFLVVIILFFIKMFIVLNNINFEKNNSHKSGINISIEPFANKYKSFCENLKGKTDELEKECNKMSNNNCTKLDCCVLLKPSTGNELKCLAGDQYGPAYHTDKINNNIDYDYFLHKNMKIENK
jgi:hypothetical protein